MGMDEKIKGFKQRKIKAREIFELRYVKKNEALGFVEENHYLGDAKFFSMYNIGLYGVDGNIYGVASYSLPQGNVALKGWFGIDNNADRSVVELTRLAMAPELNGSNATSFLLRNSANKLNKEKGIKAVISLADSSRHIGSIYQVSGFTYHGLTDPKKDFYRHDGKINPRGKTRGVEGVWLHRTRKHRYALVYDETYTIKYPKERKPNKDDLINSKCECDKGKIEDKRSKKIYKCPRCFRKEFSNKGLEEIT